MSVTERVATNVRTVARHRGITMRALALEAGYGSDKKLYSRLAGKSKISITELDELARILGVSPALLMEDPDSLLVSVGRADLRRDQSAWATADELSALEHHLDAA